MTHKEFDELWCTKEKLTEEKVQEIKELKKAQAELKTKNVETITELKKEIDHLILEKAHLFDSRLQVEVVVVDACKNIGKNTAELDAVVKGK